MNKRWKELMMLVCVLLLCPVGCGQTASPPPPPPPTVEPEVLATKSADVVGSWLMTSSPSDTMHPTEWQIEHTADGARDYTIISGAYKGMQSKGKFWFEGGLYKTQLAQATKEPNSTGVGTYQVFVTKRGGTPIQLRFVPVDDQYAGRKDRLTYQPLTRVEP
jgi:hypothetical protein